MTLVEPEWVVKCPSCGAIADPETRKIRHTATTPVPSLEQMEEWFRDDAGCETTDGCFVEVDGYCEHGHQSWMRRLGYV